jgi:hypothetical protein
MLWLNFIPVIKTSVIIPSTQTKLRQPTPYHPPLRQRLPPTQQFPKPFILIYSPLASGFSMQEPSYGAHKNACIKWYNQGERQPHTHECLQSVSS